MAETLETLTIFSLPSELHLAIVDTLDAKGIIALRQTCRAFWKLEKAHHDEIWKQHSQSLCQTTSLFSPTFSLPSSAIVDHEEVVKRALITERLLLERNAKSIKPDVPCPPPAALRYVELDGALPLTSLIHSAFLIPGGRFFLLFNDKQMQVWDLQKFKAQKSSLNAVAEAKPLLLRTFDIPWCSNAYVSTLQGAENTSVRIMLRSPHENPDVDIQAKYGVTEWDFLDLYTIHELSFSKGVPELRLMGELPMVRSGGYQSLYAFSTTTVLLQLEEHYGVLWNFMENTFAYYRLFSPSLAGPIVLRAYLSETNVSLIFLGKNSCITMPIPPMKLLAPPNHILRLPPYTPVAGQTSLLPNESRTEFVSVLLDNQSLPHVKHLATGADISNESTTSRSSFWGVQPVDKVVASIRDHYPDYIDTTTYELIPSGVFDLPESKMLGHARHVFPRYAGVESQLTSSPDIERFSNSYSGHLVTTSLWKKYFFQPRSVLATISRLDDEGRNGGQDQWKGGVWPMVQTLPPILGMDFCALSGILVVVSGPGLPIRPDFSHPVRVYDFASA